MKRMNFPIRKNRRRETALVNLKAALKQRQKELKASADPDSELWVRKNSLAKTVDRLREAINNTSLNLEANR